MLLTVLPPFFHPMWLGGGVVRLHHILRGNDIDVRAVRVLENLDPPAAVRDAALRTLALDRPWAERVAEQQRFHDAHPAFYDGILRSLRGAEAVLLSVWRTNVDVTAHIARRLRAEGIRVVLGGPEAIERPDPLREVADVIVSGAGDTVIVPLVRALGAPGAARGLPAVWVHPDHPDAPPPSAHHRGVDALGPVDYRDLAPLVAPDEQPRLPTLVNVGCVFNCGFCTNRLVYPILAKGKLEAAVEEVRALAALGVGVEFCDATLNGWPRQFAQLCELLRDVPKPPRMSGNWVVDARVDEATMEATLAAGFTDLFFGLETGNDRLRKGMRKPGSAAQVWTALQRADAVAHDVRVGFGVIAGWPDETESEFYDTVALMDRIATLERLDPAANISPLFRTPNAQDPETMGALHGPSYGVAWTADTAAGDPAVRFRRVAAFSGWFRDRVSVDYPVPLTMLAQCMLPADQAAAMPIRRPAAAPPPAAPRPKAVDLDELRRLFDLGGRANARLDVSAEGDGASVRIQDARGGTLLELRVFTRDDARRAYAHTRTLSIAVSGQDLGEKRLKLARQLVESVRRRGG